MYMQQWRRRWRRRRRREHKNGMWARQYQAATTKIAMQCRQSHPTVSGINRCVMKCARAPRIPIGMLHQNLNPCFRTWFIIGHVLITKWQYLNIQNCFRLCHHDHIVRYSASANITWERNGSAYSAIIIHRIFHSNIPFEYLRSNYKFSSCSVLINQAPMWLPAHLFRSS